MRNLRKTGQKAGSLGKSLLIQETELGGANWNQHLTVDTQKIRQLGYAEKYSIAQAIENTLAWEKCDAEEKENS